MIRAFVLASGIIIAQAACFSALASSKVEVLIETRIDQPDPQAGVKSIHAVTIDATSLEYSTTFSTGVTNLLGAQLKSVRDRFRVEHVMRTSSGIKLTLIGQTASGVMLMPNIDYKITVTLNKQGTATVSGCHDGYPSYKLTVNGKQLYSFQHKSKDLVKLFGACDVSVSVNDAPSIVFNQ